MMVAVQERVTEARILSGTRLAQCAHRAATARVTAILNSGTLNSQTLNSQTLNSQTLNSQTLNSQTIDRHEGRHPGLGVILVGENPASKAYVASKEKAAHKCGLATFNRTLESSASSDQVLAAITEFNLDPRIDGILLQLPLPAHIDSAPLIAAIDPAKDADGLHPINQGLLLQGRAHLVPCTPQGAMHLIDWAFAPEFDQQVEAGTTLPPRASLAGKTAVVIGRSILVGKPVSMMLLERSATVIMAHSKSPHLSHLVRTADIVVAAVGVPKLVKGDWIKQDAVVIDVGINRLPDGSLTGDVDFESVAPHCSAITPVPGGVGPMTVAMLIANTVEAFARSKLR